MWRFALARATGTSHTRLDLPCQDRCDCAVLPDGSIVAALADGAGSAEFSDQGAEIAVREWMSAVSSVYIGPDTDFVSIARTAAEVARNAVLAHAEAQQGTPRQFASTLLAIISTEHGGAAVQIGDGVIVANDGEKDWSWVFWPQRGEYANTTRFLTEDDATEILQVEAFSRPLSHVAMTSDGLEALAIHYASRSVHAPFFSGMLRPLIRSDVTGKHESLCVALEKYLASPAIAERTDDDVSLILATRRPQES
jgi:hypothetical protein